MKKSKITLVLIVIAVILLTCIAEESFSDQAYLGVGTLYPEDGSGQIGSFMYILDNTYEVNIQRFGELNTKKGKQEPTIGVGLSRLYNKRNIFGGLGVSYMENFILVNELNFRIQFGYRTATWRISVAHDSDAGIQGSKNTGVNYFTYHLRVY